MPCDVTTIHGDGLAFCVVFSLFLALPLLPAAQGVDTDGVQVAAISVATVESSYEANFERGLALARAAIRDRGHAAKPQLLLLPEAFAAGYPPCCGEW